MTVYRKPILNIFVVGMAILMASCSARTSTQTAEPEEDVEIRVMAYNIHHANPPSKGDEIDIDAIAKVIKAHDPDLVALQEVDVNTERSGQGNQAQLLGEKLGMNFYFGKSIDYQGGEYGVAILSKFPMDQTQVHRLPSQEGVKSEPRIMATARIKLTGGQAIRFGSTHLDHSNAENRKLQVERILEITAGEQLPFILAGDFNAVPDSEAMTNLDSEFKRSCTECPFTSSAQNPRRTIDYILFRAADGKLEVEKHYVVDERVASDHLPIVADFEIDD